ncbi:MAG: hypothetical protein GY776_22815 [Alteromonas sp.]|nr:hypothetical protein [Alteromonas sp.]
MPKTMRVTLEDVAQWDNVVNASYGAGKAKRNRPTTKHYFDQFECSIWRVQQAILAGKLCDGRYHAFNIQDPKPRIIHAAPFDDRVIHHAIVNCIGERLEKSWCDTSYACRRGFGSHRAIKQAAVYAKRFNIVIKLDVQAYFAHINHQILQSLLQRQLKDTDLFNLLDNLLASHGRDGVGLPIGALTSQYFANHYLNGFDRWLAQQSNVKAQLRYMDDVLIFCDNLAQARALVKGAKTWLKNERGLILKPAIIGRCYVGVTFCGFKVNSQGITMSQRRKRSYIQKQRALFAQVLQGEITPLNAQKQANTLAALCLPGAHKLWQQRKLQQLQPMSNIEC